MPAFRHLGPALRHLRLRAGKKQYEVARAAAIAAPSLSEYENNRKRPTLDTLERLLDALGVSLVDLSQALEMFDREAGDARPLEPARPPRGRGPDPARLLALEGVLPAEDQALTDLAEAFFRWLRALGEKPPP